MRSPDSPVWALFRLDARLHWGRRGIRRALGLLGVVLLAQALGTLAWVNLTGARPSSLWALRALGPIAGCLFSPIWYMLFQLLGPGHARFGPWSATAYNLILLVNSLPSAAISLVMPAYAAAALAREREQKRIGELLLARLTPLQILAAKGGAALVPFAALSLAVLPIDVIGRVIPLLRPEVPDGWVAYHLAVIIGRTLWLAASAIVLLAVSALCRGVLTATVACYAVALLAMPGMRLGAGVLAMRALGGAPPPATVLPSLLSLAGQAAALAALLPLASRALRLAGDSAG